MLQLLKCPGYTIVVTLVSDLLCRFQPVQLTEECSDVLVPWRDEENTSRAAVSPNKAASAGRYNGMPAMVEFSWSNRVRTSDVTMDEGNGWERTSERFTCSASHRWIRFRFFRALLLSIRSVRHDTKSEMCNDHFHPSDFVSEHWARIASQQHCEKKNRKLLVSDQRCKTSSETWRRFIRLPDCSSLQLFYHNKVSTWLWTTTVTCVSINILSLYWKKMFVRPSVRPSHGGIVSKRIFNFSPWSSHIILVFPYQLNVVAIDGIWLGCRMQEYKK